jgi:hypothetical protein
LKKHQSSKLNSFCQMCKLPFRPLPSWGLVGGATAAHRKSVRHRHLRNIDRLSFVMCPILAPVLIVNRLLFFFFCCGHLQNYWSKQGRRYAPLSSLYYIDVYGVRTWTKDRRDSGYIPQYGKYKKLKLVYTKSNFAIGYWVVKQKMFSKTR